MGFINKITAIIDPTKQNQRALNRAVLGARTTGARLHVYACIYSGMDTDDSAELSEIEKARFQPWLDGLVAPIREKGVEVEVEVEWNEDWRNAMGRAAADAGSDLVIKNSHRRATKKRSLLTSSDWSLFHTANCPVVLAKSERSSGSGKILLAVDFTHSDEQYDKTVDRMLDYARAAEESYKDGELHVICAYEGSSDYVHVTDLANRTGVENDKVHVIGDLPERAIQKCADELDAELIILGMSRTSRLAGLLFGSTTEWLLNNIDRDIMVVMQEKEKSEK